MFFSFIFFEDSICKINIFFIFALNMSLLMIFLIGLASGLMASVPLGPIGVLCIQRTLGTSRTHGFLSGLGAATADTIFAVIALFSLSYINSFIERYNFWVEIIGGLIVIIFGLSIYFKKVKRPAQNVNKSKMTYVGDYFSVLFLTLPNPAYFLVFVWIFAALGVGSYYETTTWLHQALLLIGVLVGCSSWWFTLTFLVSKLRSKFSFRGLWWLNKISGSLIMLFGVWTVISVILSLIPHLNF